MTARLMQARFPGVCGACGEPINKGESIYFDRDTSRGRRAVHERCAAPAESTDTRDAERIAAEFAPAPAVAPAPVAPAVAEVAEEEEQAPAVAPTDAGAALAAAVRAIAAGSMDERAVRRIVAEGLQKHSANIEARIAAATANAPRIVHHEVKSPAGTVLIEEHAHPVFAEVLQAVGAGLNVLLVGPAGCGKSHLGAQVARALGRKFGSLSYSAGASESQLLGWLLPIGADGAFSYVASEWVRLGEEGNSVFLHDEVDAGDANMLMVLNGALANRALHVPQRFTAPRVEFAPTAAQLAAANTYLTGPDAQYVGRNQLDAATLDRFYVVPMDYDTEYERSIGDARAVDFVHAARKVIAEQRMRRVLSTRAIQKATALLSVGADWTHVRGRLLAGWTAEERAKVKG